jgi:hypothetical protein
VLDATLVRLELFLIGHFTIARYARGALVSKVRTVKWPRDFRWSVKDINELHSGLQTLLYLPLLFLGLRFLLAKTARCSIVIALRLLIFLIGLGGVGAGPAR